MPTMPEMILELRTVHPDQIIDLRHAVLRAGYDRESAMFAGDHEPESFHIAAFDGELAIGCASLHRRPFDDEAPSAWQLRGMAVHDTHRKSGIGRRLISGIEDFVKQSTYSTMLWCNARLIAVPFYQRAGWDIVSELFEIPTAGPHYKMRKHWIST